MRTFHDLPWLAAAFALALVCTPSRDSHAGDDPDKRRELLSAIDDKVDDLVDAVEDIAGDSGERSIDTARALAYEIKQLAERLEDVAGDDATAKTIADRYPDDLDEFQAVVPYLRQLKQGQNHAGPEAQMCSERDQELVRQADAFESKNDPDGLTELPKLAAQYQDQTKRALDEARRDDDKLEDAGEAADDYAADGELRGVDSALSAAGRQMYAAGHNSEALAERACDNLLRGVDHPKVKAALANLGSSAGGRKAIIDQLDKDARALASTLAGVSEDSGVGSIDRARSLLTELERGVDNLGRSTTTDKPTKVILDKWPDAIKQVRVALDALGRLKEHQHELDSLPEKCQQRERELEDAISKNGDDTDGVEELPKRAEDLAAPVRAGLDKAKERLREEERDHDKARDISASEGPWSDIRSAAQRDADETFKTFDDGLQKTASACENILKGKEARQVKEEITSLGKHASSSGDQLTRDVEAWVADARATYITDCDAKKEMWEAECGSDREPSEEESDEDAKEVSTRLEATMRSKMEPLLRKLPELDKQVNALLEKRETKTKATPLAALLKKERERLDRLSAQGRWNGANRPYNQLATAYGKDQHVRMHSSFRCDLPKDAARQLRFDGANHLYPDCVIVTDRECKIIEFKADSKKGRRLAGRQLSDYKETVAAYYTGHLENRTSPDSEHGGADFLKRIVAAGCAGRDGNGPVVFETPNPESSYYTMCKQPYECIESN